MDQVVSTIFFDGRFWICIVERHEGGSLFLARHTFGSEPTNPELLEFYLRILPSLRFTPCGEDDARPLRTYSFKKARHKAAKELRTGMFEKKSLVKQKAKEERRLGNRKAEDG